MQNIQIIYDGKCLYIDEDTKIGIQLSAFDFGEPNKLPLTHTNVFEIPVNDHNSRCLGFADVIGRNVYTVNSDIYLKKSMKVYVGGILVLEGMCYLENVTNGRFRLAVVDSRNKFTEMQQLKFYAETGTSITRLVIDYVTDKLGGNLDTYSNMISVPESCGLKLFYMANGLTYEFPYEKLDDQNIGSLANKYEDDASYYASGPAKTTTEFISASEIVGDYNGSVWFFNLKELLGIIFEEIGVNAEYSTYLSSELSNQFIHIPDICLLKDSDTGKYFFSQCPSTYKYSISDGEIERSLTAFDVFKYFINEYCVSMDVLRTQTGYKYSFNCISDITEKKNVVLTSNPETSNIRPSVMQKSWITYKQLGSENESTTTGGLEIECKNASLEAGGDTTSLFTVNRYMCTYTSYDFGGSPHVVYRQLNIPSEANNEVIVVTPSISSASVTYCRYVNGILDESVTKNAAIALQSSVGTTTAWSRYKDMMEYPQFINCKVKADFVEFLQLRRNVIYKLNLIPGEWLLYSTGTFSPEDKEIECEFMLIR